MRVRGVYGMNLIASCNDIRITIPIRMQRKRYDIIIVIIMRRRGRRSDHKHVTIIMIVLSYTRVHVFSPFRFVLVDIRKRNGN